MAGAVAGRTVWRGYWNLVTELGEGCLCANIKEFSLLGLSVKESFNYFSLGEIGVRAQ